MNLKILSGIFKTQNFIGKSVLEQNPNIILDMEKLNYTGKTFGIKNTTQIDNNLINLLRKNGYVWNTIDKGSDRGRALDLDLLNPISGKLMTGSSSGTAINVLYGLNTIGIGTDGGGSVLAPGIALNLYTCLLSGIGLKGNVIKTSTDNINFTPGVGFISQTLDELVSILNIFKPLEKIDISIAYSSNLDKSLIEKLSRKYITQEIKETFEHSREDMISNLKEIFTLSSIYIYLEKNIDIDGIGDSVFGTLGKKALENQIKSNKKYIKVFNMINSSVISIPTGEIGTSIVIAAKHGKEYLNSLIEIATYINEEKRPLLFQEYFLNFPLKETDNRYFFTGGTDV